MGGTAALNVDVDSSIGTLPGPNWDWLSAKRAALSDVVLVLVLGAAVFAVADVARAEELLALDALCGEEIDLGAASHHANAVIVVNNFHFLFFASFFFHLWY